MTREQANKLLPLVNNIPALDALSAYVDGRIEQIKDQLLHATPPDVLELQAQAKELRKLKTLREVVIESVKNG